MQLVHEFTMSATLKPPRPVGPGPIGTRMVHEMSLLPGLGVEYRVSRPA